MFESLRRLTLGFLKVPPEPQPPIGDRASLRVFRAGRNYYRLRLAGWTVAQLFALVVFVLWTAILVGIEGAVHERHAAASTTASRAETPNEQVPPASPAPPPADASPATKNWIERGADKIRSAAENVAPSDPTQRPRGIDQWIAGYRQFFVELALLLPGWAFPLLWVVKIGSFGVYLLQIPLTYAVRRLDYEMRWYMVTDRSLRLRHGVWKVSESTMSFANVQQVVMNQGPLQRLLGLSDVKVQSAGGGGGGSHQQRHVGDDMHVGLFRHVTNATEIRDLILERLRHFRESGLGDPEEESSHAAAPVVHSSHDAVTAAQELLAEAKSLRAALG